MATVVIGIYCWKKMNRKNSEKEDEVDHCWKQEIIRKLCKWKKIKKRIQIKRARKIKDEKEKKNYKLSYKTKINIDDKESERIGMKNEEIRKRKRSDKQWKKVGKLMTMRKEKDVEEMDKDYEERRMVEVENKGGGRIGAKKKKWEIIHKGLLDKGVG